MRMKKEYSNEDDVFEEEPDEDSSDKDEDTDSGEDY